MFQLALCSPLSLLTPQLRLGEGRLWLRCVCVVYVLLLLLLLLLLGLASLLVVALQRLVVLRLVVVGRSLSL
jgi:hypothetical protein